MSFCSHLRFLALITVRVILSAVGRKQRDTSNSLEQLWKRLTFIKQFFFLHWSDWTCESEKKALRTHSFLRDLTLFKNTSKKTLKTHFFGRNRVFIVIWKSSENQFDWRKKKGRLNFLPPITLKHAILDYLHIEVEPAGDLFALFKSFLIQWDWAFYTKKINEAIQIIRIATEVLNRLLSFFRRIGQIQPLVVWKGSIMAEEISYN